MSYRHQVIMRAHIDKGGGKTRPIGISAFEDKVVQDSLRELLGAIYEQDFLDCSYGFRPGRSAHDALQALSGAVHHGEVNVVLEADIVSFFDRIDRTKLKQLLEQRLADKSLLRLIGWAPYRAPRSRRCWRTCTCTTCWTSGSKKASNRH